MRRERFFGECTLSIPAGNLRDSLSAYTPEVFAADPVQHAVFELKETPPMLITTNLIGLDRRALLRSAAWADVYGPLQMEHLLGWRTGSPNAGPSRP